MAGGVSDGQAVSAGVTNPAFLIKNADDSTTFNIALASAAGGDGSTVSRLQRFCNAVASYTGVAVGAVFNVNPAWTSSVVGSATDSLFTRLNLITALFNGTIGTGHSHDGTDGHGPVIQPAGGGTGQITIQAAIDALAAAGGVPAAGMVLTFNGTHWLPSAASGGGGGSLNWVEAADSPVPGVSSNILSYAFQAASSPTQKLYALVKVPSSYVAGNPIKLKLDFYSSGSSGNVLIQSIATLIRQALDTISSTTNQRTSTNAATTISGGTVNVPLLASLDLTDSTGNINSVAVSAGDYILVQLTRNASDTATADANVPVYGAEVTFT